MRWLFSVIFLRMMRIVVNYDYNLFQDTNIVLTWESEAI
jgi:hypothetical protein